MSSWDDFKKVAQETVGKAPGAGQYVHVHRDSAFELIAEHEALLAERDAAQKDAERYRWLRDPCSGAERVIFYCRGDYGRGLMSSAMLDAVIDAALQGEQP